MKNKKSKITAGKYVQQNQNKDTKKSIQLRIFSEYCFNNIATVAMISEATGLKEKNLCRYKRTLEKRNLLFKVYRGLCKKTGFKAWYLTTNINLKYNYIKDNFTIDKLGGL